VKCQKTKSLHNIREKLDIVSQNPLIEKVENLQEVRETKNFGTPSDKANIEGKGPLGC
jgi:hypothetical protein